MKKYTIPILLLCAPAVLAAPTLSEDDLFHILTSKWYELTPAETLATQGKDCIVTAVFSDKAAWVHSIPSDERSYIGVQREHERSEVDSFSCAGGLEGGFVFNRAQPGSTIGNTVIRDTPTTPYTVREGAPITLQQVRDAIESGYGVAAALLRSPAEQHEDVLAVSIWDGAAFTDYAVGCEIATAADTVGLTLLCMDDSRFARGYAFLGQNYTYEDAIEANHYALTGIITPEPATASLGLLALAALAMRRQRR